MSAKHEHELDIPDTGDAGDLRRRDFVALSVAGAAAATALPATAVPAGPAVVEKNVTIQTPDGTCNAAYFHPAAGKHPAVILWPDAFGLRPSMRDMGRRLAGDGYAVLVPNPFYRVGPGPFYETAANVDFNDKATFAKIGPLMGSIGASGAAEKDAVEFVKFLDAQPEVDKGRKIGTQGYCMGGALVFRTAAAVPARVGAGASFHGGGLVTDKPDSPYTLIPRMKARMLVAIAGSDDARQPDAKDTLRKAFDDAHVAAKVEVFAEQHGWCVPDMPHQDGKPIYNQADAERAWSELLALYKSALA
ncbi:MAG: dienelactone hydrolase family protein [Burkholderiaceae bacterium]